jgi:hypothetical protein
VVALDEQDDDRCRDLYRAILHRALDDLTALLNGADIPVGEDGIPLSEGERRELLIETLDWFLGDTPGPCSLESVCDVLKLAAEPIRDNARKLAHGQIRAKIRRKKLTDAQVLYILDSLGRGETAKSLAELFQVDGSTIRKIRIRSRRREAAAA